MKNKVIAAALIALFAVAFTSCASRKYGCPSVSSIQKARSTNS